MIAPAGNHPREAFPQPGGNPAETQAAPEIGFEQLLDSLEAAEQGFLGGSLPSPGAAARQLAGAEMFNERGLFARGGAAVGASPPPDYEAATSPTVKAPANMAAAGSAGRDSANPLTSVRAEGPLPGAPPELVAPVALLPAAVLQEDYPGCQPVGRGGANPPAVTAPAPPAFQLPATVSPAPTGSVPDLEPIAPPQAAAQPPLRHALNRTAVRLDMASGPATVTTLAEGLTAEERDRLERRIAGELARHGLAIGRIAVSAPQAVSNATEGE